MTPLDESLRSTLVSRTADLDVPPDLLDGVERRARGLRRRRVAATVAGSALAVVAVAVAVPALDSRTSVVQQPATQPGASDAPYSPTRTFVSPRNGFSLEHPEPVTLTPAKQLLGFSKQVDDGFDVLEIDAATVFKGTSTGFPVGRCADTEDEPTSCGSVDDQVDRYLSDDVYRYVPGECGVPRSQQAEMAVDGRSGRVSECPNRIEASVATGGRLYLFTLAHDRRDARALFDAIVATIDLTPDNAVDYPGTTTTFVSPTYGYSFGYIDRGGLAPATERWDPGNQPFDDVDDFDARFDAVETGLTAYFEAASTPVRDGVPIDEWVDERVTPRAAGGCGVPRRQQAEIAVDGQPGRVAECANRVEATVVVGGRLYLFVLKHQREDARAMFDAWIATVELTPETADSR